MRPFRHSLFLAAFLLAGISSLNAGCDIPPSAPQATVGAHSSALGGVHTFTFAAPIALGSAVTGSLTFDEASLPPAVQFLDFGGGPIGAPQLLTMVMGYTAQEFGADIDAANLDPSPGIRDGVVAFPELNIGRPVYATATNPAPAAPPPPAPCYAIQRMGQTLFELSEGPSYRVVRLSDGVLMEMITVTPGCGFAH